MFNNSPGLSSLALQTNAHGGRDAARMTENFEGNNDVGGRRSGNKENEISRSGSDNMDVAGSGDDGDTADNRNPHKKKKYQRPTPQQIEELKALFKKCPGHRTQMETHFNVDDQVEVHGSTGHSDEGDAADNSNHRKKKKYNENTPQKMPQLEAYFKDLLYQTQMKTHFKENDQVEVHDSTGPYYPATVICPFFKDKDSILVKYQTQTNFGGFQLREIMLVTKVRPTPPTELHRLFKVGDDVDAVIAKEWYRGTVMKILENSTYLVMVDCLADQQFMFDQCDLRVHREWVDGSWVPPFPEELKSQKETVRKKFEKGTLVEVSFNDEVGFEGAWFSGTIVDNKEKDKYRVEYKDLVDDGGKLLIDDVLASSIRPCPRLPPVVRFKCLQKVDAWYRDGWWEGSISKVLTGSKYGVYFSHHDEEIEFNHSHLRLHQDWLDGHWVTQVHD